MDINLLNFFVFNSNFGPREGEEHKRILFYHPSAIDIDTKIKQVGLCEAIIKFSQTFTDEPCSNVHTQKTRQLFLQVEPEYWMIMTVSVPYSQRSKDGQSFIEYHEDDVQDSVYDAVLHQAYDMFKFFNGTMEKIVAESGIEELLRRLEHFFSKYLITLKLSQSSIMDVINGIHFLPLDKNTYLRIQCFINLLEAQFPRVKYTAFLFNDQLVWSGLEQEDMRVLYAYLTTGLFPSYNESELQGPQSKSANTAHHGKFILGPPNLKDETNVGKIPRIYLIRRASAESEECLLAVYRALNASVCLIMDGHTSLSFDYLRKLDRFLGPQLSSLATDIGDQYGKRSN
ncbi:hypothetical protein CAPTEDRAFT_170709 [Capitella teleta]|uniref:CCZ1/INTU/HSP4 first Longin domain-containing protein n=1 Tax=Capitella teleta TaxID=283909 RepID=R7TLK6_CAPTE|nr:hypothetical protein CAPTEDRAFT_170709 [Capitella teleta]|eukprot:ELT94377.1 hypothetical protein CAPTEDRAFT_170709 [Capitella teleta]